MDGDNDTCQCVEGWMGPDCTTGKHPKLSPIKPKDLSSICLSVHTKSADEWEWVRFNLAFANSESHKIWNIFDVSEKQWAYLYTQYPNNCYSSLWIF